MIGTVLIVLAVLFVIVAALVGWWIGTYNTFQVAITDIKTQWSNVKTEYQRRADLFMNLVEAVKSHKKFEKSTLVEVIKARSGNFGGNVAKQKKTLEGLDSLFSKLMVVFERYPELKSNEQHNKLMEEVRISEDRINVARTDYNEIVGDYNKLVLTFPSNVIAKKYNFKLNSFFETKKDVSEAPIMKL